LAAGRSGQALLVALLAAALFAVPSSAGAFAAPVISSFTPTAAAVGASVSVSGSGFTGATDFYFDGGSAAFSVTSDVQIVATVPWGATSGPLKVTTPSGSGTSTTEFKVRPKIAGFTPTSGPYGTSVSVTGSAFTSARSSRPSALSP
jgi:large repetitive protein